MKRIAVIVLLMMYLPVAAQQATQVSLATAALQLHWKQFQEQWRLNSIVVNHQGSWQQLPHVNGEYTFLYAKEKPDTTPVALYDKAGKQLHFPEPIYRYILPLWEKALQPVSMNTAGEAAYLYPSAVKKTGNQTLCFTAENDKASIIATWQPDTAFPADILVKISLQAKAAGYFSLATPTLATVPEKELAWGGIPGYFQSNAIEKDFIKAYAYMQGIPDKPVIVRERTAATLAAFVSTRQHLTIGVIPAPGTGRDPWEHAVKTQDNWQTGLSLMNRKASLTPTAYHPVLGEKGSFLEKGDTVTFSFRYTIRRADWYTVFKHAVNDVYHFADFLSLKKTRQSLSSRILTMYQYLINDSTSLWKREQYNGVDIGAQAYLGGVYGAQKDAMKNADYGAMWMLAAITEDTVLQQTRLPYARNFKLQQQDHNPGFFHGATAGQYYLTKSKRFTEEWGPYTEPIGITYYMLMDIGNLLLFQPGDTTLRKALQAAADKLLAWMDTDGHWEVAYDLTSGKPMFTDIADLRPTFYGLLVAYNILKDEKYLAAARKGADWYIREAIQKGHFLGVCGDTRFVPDFATGQSAQAFLHLYETTREEKYLRAAIRTAQLYTTSIYTHPIPSAQKKIVNGMARQDWEISQVGLSFEHGGTLGSANQRGPILLASHAGMFVNMFMQTHDSLFLHMARAAALGRDAFVDTTTGVASYYWDVMNKGAGPYPHHAWWQIGWITDYLLAEIKLRSAGSVTFPHGFITPKVGPHLTYGFATGSVYGTPAKLLLKPGLIEIANPYIDYYCAINTAQKKLWLISLNNDDDAQKSTVQIDYTKVINHTGIKPVTVFGISNRGERTRLSTRNSFPLTLAPYGLQVIEINYQLTENATTK
ncbi:glycerophosphoryl diester phosphodiesterase [Chitinophaga nivalis]|uniref:Glycerophosphoryl diester phosphodiesterase n=1 Tax=Chitinophaga nivalis TaxID=2991709 RepID=A0ABT3IJT6_9BACT|nr:glycerophosphoryl diester phosphodiesterase [Chitinophaga nivalis]MCW3466105.1 glycerophosphoryl diester phosphodiesterase [Chitinophaga nivalis]MCW3484204.1 glycerophosphoryl diester phosphodiesterase [Chitinophaga nivalis]